MSMKTTTIRITQEQMSWIRQNRPQQLSMLVRAHLDDLIHSETPVNFHNAWRESAQKCYPHMRGGYCSLCWPTGIPSREEWTAYVKSSHRGSMAGNISHVHSVQTFTEWSMEKHARRQSSLQEWNEPVESKKRRGFLEWFRRVKKE